MDRFWQALTCLQGIDYERGIWPKVGEFARAAKMRFGFRLAIGSNEHERNALNCFGFQSRKKPSGRDRCPKRH